MTGRKAWGIVALVVAAAAILGWFRPIELPVRPLGSGAGAWRLPTEADLERSSLSQYNAIRGVAWVGGAGAAAGQASEWTLLGIAGADDDRAALIRVGKEPAVRRFGAGDTLPDGSRLVDVGNRGIAIERDGCRVLRALYPTSENPDPDPDSGDCPPPTLD